MELQEGQALFLEEALFVIMLGTLRGQQTAFICKVIKVKKLISHQNENGKDGGTFISS